MPPMLRALEGLAEGTVTRAAFVEAVRAFESLSSSAALLTRKDTTVLERVVQLLRDRDCSAKVACACCALIAWLQVATRTPSLAEEADNADTSDNTATASDYRAFNPPIENSSIDCSLLYEGSTRTVARYADGLFSLLFKLLQDPPGLACRFACLCALTRLTTAVLSSPTLKKQCAALVSRSVPLACGLLTKSDDPLKAACCEYLHIIMFFGSASIIKPHTNHLHPVFLDLAFAQNSKLSEIGRLCLARLSWIGDKAARPGQAADEFDSITDECFLLVDTCKRGLLSGVSRALLGLSFLRLYRALQYLTVMARYGCGVGRPATATTPSSAPTNSTPTSSTSRALLGDGRVIVVNVARVSRLITAILNCAERENRELCTTHLTKTAGGCPVRTGCEDANIDLLADDVTNLERVCSGQTSRTEESGVVDRQLEDRPGWQQVVAEALKLFVAVVGSLRTDGSVIASRQLREIVGMCFGHSLPVAFLHYLRWSPQVLQVVECLVRSTPFLLTPLASTCCSCCTLLLRMLVQNDSVVANAIVLCNTRLLRTSTLSCQEDQDTLRDASNVVSNHGDLRNAQAIGRQGALRKVKTCLYTDMWRNSPSGAPLGSGFIGGICRTMRLRSESIPGSLEDLRLLLAVYCDIVRILFVVMSFGGKLIDGPTRNEVKDLVAKLVQSGIQDSHSYPACGLIVNDEVAFAETLCLVPLLFEVSVDEFLASIPGSSWVDC